MAHTKATNKLNSDFHTCPEHPVSPGFGQTLCGTAIDGVYLLSDVVLRDALRVMKWFNDWYDEIESAALRGYDRKLRFECSLFRRVDYMEETRQVLHHLTLHAYAVARSSENLHWVSTMEQDHSQKVADAGFPQL